MCCVRRNGWTLHEMIISLSIMGIVLAAGSFLLALAFGLYAFQRRRTRDADDG